MKHGNKILALLMAFMLIIGMMPTSFAWSDDHPCAQGNHAWGPKEYFGDATCVEEASWVRECSVCGCQEDGEDLGSHSFGAWNTIQEGNCTQERVERRSCQHCGETEERRTPGSGHSFGEWHVVTAPSCVKNGREEHVCSRCGYTEFRATDMVDHNMGEWYVFEEPQVGLPGIERRDCLNECGYLETREIPALEQDFDNVVINPGDVNLDPDGNVNIYNPDGSENAEDEGNINNGQPGDDEYVVVTPGEPESAGVYLEKFIRNAPANGEYYVPGEVLNYALTLRIDDGLLLDDAAIYDPIIGNDGLVISYGKGLYGGMGMDVFYTVTEEDAQRGYVENTAYATWSYSDSGKAGYCESATVIAPCGVDKSGDFGLTAALSVTKAVTSTPANGRYYEPGEDITFVITVSNQGSEQLLNVNVIDPLGGGLVTVLETLNAGETRDVTVVFTTTDIVAWAGSVDNGACVKAVDKDGRQYVEYSNIVTVPCGHTFLDIIMKPDNPFGVITALEVTKAVESLPLNGSYYTKGETVAYRITYTNTGEIALTNVAIYDALKGMSEVASAESLNPGESRYCTFNYTVTDEDVACGYISNTAVGQFEVENFVFSSSSNTVVVDTDGKPDPAAPETPVIPGAPGTIDTGKLQTAASDYCVRTITGRDNASASYEITFCKEHVDTQSTALLMLQAATTPELKVQAANYAISLWRSEAEALYQKICDSADSVAKANVMAEYVGFLTDISLYEAMLKMLYPDQPALIAQKIAAMWEDKCVTLCYEAHAAASQRKDSLLSVTPTTGATAENCACAVTAEENGKKAYTQSFCPVHGFTFSMIDALLQGKDTQEAWAMVHQIWNLELNSAYGKIASMLGEHSGFAAVEFNALTQWMQARESVLKAMYPQNPELVAQTLVKIVMDRVNDLCQIVK